MKAFPITSNDAEQRLDKFLKKLFPNAVRSLIYKLNRKGKIKVIIDGKKTKQDNEYKLQEGQIVQVFVSDSEIQELMQEKRVSHIPSWEKLSKQDIVFEDKALLVINKNPGQNVHPGNHKTKEVSLIEQVHDYLWEKLSSLTFKPSLIHRIDRDTSGIIMIAKDKQTLTQLSACFKKKDALKKVYYALVVWRVSRRSGTIRKKLKRIENAKNENKVQVSESGQEAVSHYKVLDEYEILLPSGAQYVSCVEVCIETGRMHQIRVHMSALGNPILGDMTYGDKKLNGYFTKHYGVTRQMLHAWKITFPHPSRRKMMELEARLKKDMMQVIACLKKK